MIEFTRRFRKENIVARIDQRLPCVKTHSTGYQKKRKFDFNLIFKIK